MDGNRFDYLTRALAQTRTRRTTVKGLIGSAAAMIGVALGSAGADAQLKSCKVGCASLSGKQRKACEKACNECSGDFNRICSAEGPFGPTEINCCPVGTFCIGGTGVCCEEGTDPCFGPDGDVTCCSEGTFCDFDTGLCGPPAVCGPDSGCLGGICGSGCFCVTSVEGDGACINAEFANCEATPCKASADCGAGGVCVDVTSDMCCGGTPSAMICIPPEGICQTGGTASRTFAPGWHH